MPVGREAPLHLFLVFVVYFITVMLLMWDRFDSLQISFQEFKNKLLEPGLVDHIVVTNKSVAKIYVRTSSKNQTDSEVLQGTLPAKGSGGQYKYFFNIGSVESFEEKLEEAQDALGVDPHDFVPVTYSSEMVWYQELLRFAPTLLLLGSLFYMGRRMQGGLGVGGGAGGKGGRGIFNIGKAHITKVDKNAKNKVGSLLILLLVMVDILYICFLTACYLVDHCFSHSHFFSVGVVVVITSMIISIKRLFFLFEFILFRSILKMLLAVMRQSKKLWSLCTSSRTLRNMKSLVPKFQKVLSWLVPLAQGKPF